MKKILSSIVILVLVLTSSFILTSYYSYDYTESYQPIYTDDGSQTVFIPGQYVFGNHYHRYNCGEECNTYNLTSITLEEAVKRDYIPCPYCNPPRLEKSSISSVFGGNSLGLIIIISLFALLIIIIILLTVLLLRTKRKNSNTADTKDSGNKISSDTKKSKRLFQKNISDAKTNKHKGIIKLKKSKYNIKLIMTWILCIIAPITIIFLVNLILVIIQGNIGMDNAFILGGIPQLLIFGAFISLGMFLTRKYKREKYKNIELEVSEYGSWCCPVCNTDNLYTKKCEKCNFEPVFANAVKKEKLIKFPNGGWVCPKCKITNGNYDICTNCWTDRRDETFQTVVPPSNYES